MVLLSISRQNTGFVSNYAATA